MISTIRMSVRMVILAHFFMAPGSWSQDVPLSIPKVEGVDLGGLAIVNRRVDNTYPVSDSPEIFVSNKYGDITISTWSNPLVRVTANIQVGAENSLQADRFAQEIEVAGNHIGDKVEVRTVYPDRKASNNLGYTVDLDISVPENTRVTIENLFGDCFVSGLSGELNVDSRYGVVELRDLKGAVHVRAKGEFPLTARNLSGGGSFVLRSTQAVFNRIDGPFQVNNYLGSIALRGLGPNLDADVTCESGPIHLYLNQDSMPNLDAAAYFGEIQTDFVLNRESWGDTRHLNFENEESSQRVSLRASFETVHIHRESLEPTVEPLDSNAAEPVQQVVSSTIPVTPEVELLIDATAGDIEIVGVDDATQVSVKATRYVRVASLENAKMALEGLALRLDNANGTIKVQSVVQEDMAALGCTYYKMDLQVRFPKGMVLRVVGQNGTTTVRHTENRVVLDQVQGVVELTDNSGELDITAQHGDVTIREPKAAVKISAFSGTVHIEKPAAQISVESAQGKVVVDTPGAGVQVHNTGGDIRIIALEGVHGDFDIAATDGNISMAMPNTADVWLFLNTEDGTVYSSIPVNGTIEQNTQTFQGRINKGTHRVMLETHQGNIVLD